MCRFCLQNQSNILNDSQKNIFETPPTLQNFSGLCKGKQFSKVGLSAERKTFGFKTKKSLELRLHSFSLAAC